MATLDGQVVLVSGVGAQVSVRLAYWETGPRRVFVMGAARPITSEDWLS